MMLSDDEKTVLRDDSEPAVLPSWPGSQLLQNGFLQLHGLKASLQLALG